MSVTITIPTAPTWATEPAEHDEQWLRYEAHFGADVVLVRGDYVDLDTFTAESGPVEILLGDDRYPLEQAAELARCLTAAVEAARG